MKIKMFLSLVLLIPLVGCSLIRSSQTSGPITASGTIEADSIQLSAEVSGKIVEVKADRGDAVTAGEMLFRLDDSALQAQRRQAAASLQAAQANQAAAQASLDLLRAGATPEQLQSAQAQLNQAEADLQAAQAEAWGITGSSRPEDITAAQRRLNISRAGYYSMTVTLSSEELGDVHAVLTQADSILSQARARKNQLAIDQRTPPSALDSASTAITDTQIAVDSATQADQAVQDASLPFYQKIAAVHTELDTANLILSQAQARQTELRADSSMIQPALDAAQSAVNDAQTLQSAAQQSYNSLNTSSQGTRLSSAWTEVQNAQNDLNSLGQAQQGGPDLEAMLNQLNAASAQRDMAQADLTGLKTGPQPDQMSAAQAQVDSAKAQAAAAQAALDAIDVQIARLTVVSPMNGVVLNRALNVGEMAELGSPVFEIGGLAQLTLTVYLPEDQ
ncbi:MAG TPA: biotin/lipoyl-binding protein, partial [Anaerolineales bacterium]